jgi:hypothetical protein
VEEELVFGEFDVGLVGVNDPVRTPLQGGFELDGVRLSRKDDSVGVSY